MSTIDASYASARDMALLSNIFVPTYLWDSNVGFVPQLNTYLQGDVNIGNSNTAYGFAINGVPYVATTVSDWAKYPALANVNMSGFMISNLATPYGNNPVNNAKGAAVSFYNDFYTGMFSPSMGQVAFMTSMNGFVNLCSLVITGGGVYNLSSSSNFLGGVTLSASFIVPNFPDAQVAIGSNAGSINQRANSIAIGSNAGTFNQNWNAVAIGVWAGQYDQSQAAVAVGVNAGNTSQGFRSTAVGMTAGYCNQAAYAVALGAGAGWNYQGQFAVALGSGAGNVSQGVQSIAIGSSAGGSNQNSNAIAVGTNAANFSQGVQSIAIGSSAGGSNQNSNAIAIGTNAANFSQGVFSIAIGASAGYSNQISNSIILNSTGTDLYSAGGSNYRNASGFYVAPIRAASDNAGYAVLAYNTVTSEVVNASAAAVRVGGVSLSSGFATLSALVFYGSGGVTLSLDSLNSQTLNVSANIVNLSGTQNAIGGIVLGSGNVTLSKLTFYGTGGVTLSATAQTLNVSGNIVNLSGTENAIGGIAVGSGNVTLSKIVFYGSGGVTLSATAQTLNVSGNIVNLSGTQNAIGGIAVGSGNVTLSKIVFYGTGGVTLSLGDANTLNVSGGISNDYNSSNTVGGCYMSGGRITASISGNVSMSGGIVNTSYSYNFIGGVTLGPIDPNQLVNPTTSGNVTLSSLNFYGNSVSISAAGSTLSVGGNIVNLSGTQNAIGGIAVGSGNVTLSKLTFYGTGGVSISLANANTLSVSGNIVNLSGTQNAIGGIAVGSGNVTLSQIVFYGTGGVSISLANANTLSVSGNIVNLSGTQNAIGGIAVGSGNVTLSQIVFYGTGGVSISLANANTLSVSGNIVNLSSTTNAIGGIAVGSGNVTLSQIVFYGTGGVSLSLANSNTLNISGNATVGNMALSNSIVSGINTINTRDVQRNWLYAASSANGTRLYASDSTSVYRSTNSGLTWSQILTGVANPYIACSSNGSNVYVTNYNNYIYRSLDGGDNWSNLNANSLVVAFWESIACSSDGTAVFAVADGGVFSYSFNSGDTWINRGAPGNNYAVACSADGTRVLTGNLGSGDTNLFMHTFTSLGVYIGTVTLNSAFGIPVDTGWVGYPALSSSADGSRLIGRGSGKIYVSVNSGSNWSALGVANGLPESGFISVASSSNGYRLAALTGGSLYTSADGGSNWTTVPIVVLGAGSWTSVASSADGTQLTVVGNNNFVNVINMSAGIQLSNVRTITTLSGFYVAPVRKAAATEGPFSVLAYSSNTNEIVTASGAGVQVGGVTLSGGNITAATLSAGSTSYVGGVRFSNSNIVVTSISAAGTISAGTLLTTTAIVGQNVTAKDYRLNIAGTGGTTGFAAFYKNGLPFVGVGLDAVADGLSIRTNFGEDDLNRTAVFVSRNSDVPYVGIQRTDPQYELDVSGSMRVTSNITVGITTLSRLVFSGTGGVTLSATAQTLSVSGNISNASNTSNNIGNVTISAGYIIPNFANGQIAIGSNAGVNNQRNYSVAIGLNAAEFNQSGGSVAIGPRAGGSNQYENAVSIGYYAGNISQGKSSVAIGDTAAQSNQKNNSIAIGTNAANISQDSQSVAVGYNAGSNLQGGNSVAIGTNAGQLSQGINTVAVGLYAGCNTQGERSIAVGTRAGEVNQTIDGIAVGYGAGQNNQGTGAIAIGRLAGNMSQGTYSIAIGGVVDFQLPATKFQFSNSIVINATSLSFDTVSANNYTDTSGLFVAPIRNETTLSGFPSLAYNTTTREVVQRGIGQIIAFGSLFVSTVQQYKLRNCTYTVIGNITRINFTNSFPDIDYAVTIASVGGQVYYVSGKTNSDFFLENLNTPGVFNVDFTVVY